MVYNKEQMYMETCKSTNTRDPACKRSKGRVHFMYIQSFRQWSFCFYDDNKREIKRTRTYLTMTSTIAATVVKTTTTTSAASATTTL